VAALASFLRGKHTMTAEEASLVGDVDADREAAAVGFIGH